MLRNLVSWARALSLLVSVGLAGYAIYDAFQPAPAAPKPPPFPHFDKVKHFAAYFALTTLLSYGLMLWPKAREWVTSLRGSLVAWAFVTTLGALSELIQHLMDQGRIGDWLDVAANALGALAACLLFRIGQSVDRARRAERADMDIGTVENA